MLRRLFPLFLLFVARSVLVADIGVPLSEEFESDFARAADFLDDGRRSEAEALLGPIRASERPAWRARVAMLLARDDERRKDFRGAAEELAAAPAAPIGLEPYRQWQLGRVLAAQGKWDEAIPHFRDAFETEESFAMRASAGEDFAEALAKKGRVGDAARVLERASDGASPGQIETIGIERIRLARLFKDSAAVRSIAHAMVAAGVDVRRTQPEFARRALTDELARLTPPEKARFARLRIAADDVARGVRLLQHENPRLWPAEERAANLLALARGQRRLGYARAADATLAKVPDDGTEAALEARVARADAALEKLRKRFPDGVPPEFSPLLAQRQALSRLADPSVPVTVRTKALERLIRIACDRGQFEEGVSLARRLVAESGDIGAGFEPLWRAAWQSYLAGDYAAAGSRLELLLSLSPGIAARRRLTYWRARCLERMERNPEATVLLRSLAEADPADIYALFARRRVGDVPKIKPASVADPATATAAFRRADELLRVHAFRDSAAEARALPPSRGRDLRLAQADFAVGHFATAVVHAKRAFPEMGTAEEGGVPESWRRLYYPIEEGGYIKERAEEFHLDPAMLRALIRQESVFEAGAKSRAGALGLMQLMPATARGLSRSVLRQRYRKAFLYDPGINTRLGAAYLKDLLDHFQGRALFALAAYNGGPNRMDRVIRENPGRPEDELFESHPFAETRDYVRRVLLYAESYRELYS
ncbi:MAG TPA: lytic transglycosylase domain-containing protein [Thermoanaerobaculia bacterium]